MAFAVREEGVELDAEEAALRQEGAVLLDGGEEVLRGLFREDDGLAAEGTDLGSADVEDIAQTGQIRQGEVAGGTGEGVAQPGAVDEQGQAVLMGNRLKFSEFGTGIDGSVFRGQGDVHETRPYHVVLVWIRGGGSQEGFQFAWSHLSVMLGEGQYLVPGVLDRARFMDGDMAGLHGDGALIVREHRGDDGGVGLGAAHQEMDFALRAVASFKNLPFRALGVRIVSVAVQLFEVGFGEPLEYLRMGSFRVIASEKNHNSLC